MNISSANLDIDTANLFQNDIILSVSGQNTDTAFRNTELLLGSSISNVDVDVNTVKNNLQSEIDTKANASELSTLTTVVEGIGSAQAAFDTLQTAYNVANELWKANVDGYMTLNTSEVEEIQLQVDDLAEHAGNVDNDLNNLGISVNNNINPKLEQTRDIVENLTITGNNFNTFRQNWYSTTQAVISNLMVSSNNINNTQNNIISVSIPNIPIKWKLYAEYLCLILVFLLIQI